MCKKALLAFLLLLPLLSACGGSGHKNGNLLSERRIPELISAVPSDALAVVCFDRCEDGLALYDSTSVLHKLDLSAFSHAAMALSLCYNGSLVPVLALDADRTEAVDSASAVSGLLAQAASLRLQAEYVHPDPEAKRRGFLVITPSNAQLTAVRRHLTEYTSILDAPGFTRALAAAPGGNFVIFRNGGAERLMPKGWLQDCFPRRELSPFLGAVAEWTVLTPEADGFAVTPVCSESDSFYANILAAMPPAESRLGALLPEQTGLALALPVSGQQTRDALERWQDASVKLTQYRRQLDALKRESGKDPLKWEKELDVREVALVHFDGGAVTLVRPGKAVPDRGPEANPWAGFLPVLYGGAFALPDDSFSASTGGWYIYGSEAAVQAFLDAPRPAEDAPVIWPGKSCRFILRDNTKTLAWGKKGIQLIWNSNL